MADFSNDWVMGLETKIYNTIMVRVKKDIGSKFPNLNFTLTDQNTSTPKYPNVYFHQLPFAEIGSDLEHLSINGVYYSMQIEIYSNKGQSEVNQVSLSVINAFKRSGFTINQFPEFRNKSTVYRSIMRVSRYIGAGDEL